MTLATILARGRALAAAARPRLAGAARWAWTHRTLVLAVLVALLAATNLRACQRASSAEKASAAAAKRSGGEAKAAAAGIPVAREVPQATVDAEGERAKKDNPVLRARLERAEKELGKLRLEFVARIRTEPAPALAAVAQGEQLRLGADLVVATTKDGAHLLEGSLEAWKVVGPADVLVLRQPYSAPVTFAVTAAPAGKACEAREDRSYRVGVVGGASGQGWLAGGAATRRVDLWGWRPEGIATAAAGPGGVVLLGGVLF